MAFHNWPYTNIHDLNLDWILEQLKNFSNQLSSFNLYFPHFDERDNGRWNPLYNYDINTIVYTDDAIYIAKRNVPTGISITNTAYWLKIANIVPDIANLDSRVSALENADYYVTPEMFGAKGDGQTDDTVHIQNCINNANGRPIKMAGIYKISSTIHLYSDCTTELDMTSGQLIVDNDISDAIIVGEHLNNNSDYTMERVEIHGGVLDLNSKATNGITVKGDLRNVNIHDLTIFNVYNGNGILCESSASGNISRKNFMHNITILGSTLPINDTDSTGIKVLSWDAIISDISTHWVYTGIYSVGGAIITNHHHWTPRTHYANAETYNESTAIYSRDAVQVTNLYSDCGIGIKSVNGPIIADNIKIESKASQYPASDNIILSLIKTENNRCAIKLGSYTWVHNGTDNVKMLTINIPQDAYTDRVSQIALPTTPFQHIKSTVNEGNNLIISGNHVAPVWRRIADCPAWDTAKFYLIGYLGSGSTLTQLYQLEILWLEDISKIVFAKTGSRFVIKEAPQQQNLGTLHIGPAETIDGVTVMPVYMQPSNRASAMAWKSLNIKLDGHAGPCAFYPAFYEYARNVIAVEDVSSVAEIQI